MRYYIQFVFTLLLARILTSQAAAIAFQTFTSTNVSEPYYQATFAPYNNPPDVITCTRNGNIGKRCYQSIYFETPVTAQSATYSRCYGYDGGPACWLDDACFDKADCCSNYIDLCKRPSVTNVIPRFLTTNTASTSKITIIGAEFGAATDPKKTFDISMKGKFYFRRSALTNDTLYRTTEWFGAEIATYAPVDDGDICGTSIPIEIVNEYGMSTKYFVQSATFSYRPPTIVAMSSNTGSTAGGDLITLQGTSFGPPSSLAATRVTVNNVTTTLVSKDHGSIVFVTPSGSGINLPVVVSWCGQSSAPYLFRYSTPVLTSMTPPANIVAGQTLTIDGDNFGPDVSVITIKLGENTCSNVVMTVPHRRLTCTVPIGCCSQQDVTAIVAGQASNTLYTNYARPAITAISPSVCPTIGGNSITLTGTSFGSSAMGSSIPLSVTIGAALCDASSTACQVTQWTDTQIVLNAPVGEGVNIPVYVYVGDQYSISPKYISYNPPVITNVVPNLANTNGTTVITLSGTDFGLTGRVTVNGKTCTSPTRSFTQIICTAPSGAGVNVPVLLVVAGQSSNSYTAFSYKRPVIDTINTLGSSVIVTADTTGGRSITLAGENFSAEPTVRIGTKDCYFVTRSHMQIVCTTPEGEGTNLPISVVAGGQSSTEPFLFSYNPPVITSFSPPSAPTSGGSAFTVLGANFGTIRTVTIGTQVCPVFSHTHTEIVCTVPAGMGIDLTVAMNVAGQVDTADDLVAPLANKFSYSAPTILAFSPMSGVTTGGYMITLTGVSFGTAGAMYFRPPSCSTDPTVACADERFSCSTTAGLPAGASWGHSQIICPVPEFYGPNHKLRLVRNDTVTSISTDMFSYNTPMVTAIQPSNGPTVGGTIVTLTGTNFGKDVATVTLNGTACTVLSRSHTQIVFTATPGYGIGNEVIVNVMGSVSNAALFSYDDPVLTSVAPAGLPTLGGQSITLTGTSFSGVAAAVAVTVGNVDCPVTAATQTTIVCTLPAGGGSRLVRVSVNSLSTQISNQLLYRYASPTIDTLQQGLSTTPFFNTAGGETVTINGSNFGTDIPNVQIAGKACTGVAHIGTTHSILTCTTPSANGLNQNVLITVNGVSGNKAIYNTAPPVITSVTNVGGQAARATSGGTVITIAGSNFGTLATVTVGSQRCPVIEASRSHTSLECTLPAGAGSNLSLYVSVLTRNSDSVLFSYADPIVDSFTPTTSATAGGAVLTVNGLNFGPPGGSVVVGSRTCVTVSGGWSHTQIKCTVPAGMGTNLKVGLSRGGTTVYNTNGNVFNYAPPTITAVAPMAPTSGGTSVTISGDNLGIFSATENSVSVTLPNASVVPAAIVYQTHKQVVFTSPPGYGTNLLVTAVVGGQSASFNGFNYQKPALQTSAPTSGPTDGNTLVTVTGVSFGATAGSMILKLSTGDAAVTGANIISWSHTKVVFKSPAGSGRNVRIVLQTSDGQLTTETTFLFHYNSPSLTQLEFGGLTSGFAVPTGPLLTGDRLLTLTGSSFSFTGTVTVNTPAGELVCDHTVEGGSWSHTQIICRVPEGRGAAVSIVVNTATGASNQMLFAYADPVVTATAPSGGPTSGKNADMSPYLITITGTSFAASAGPTFSASVMVSTADCPVVSQTHDQIVCELPPGSGTADVQVMVGTRKSNIESYSYAAPIITGFSPLNGPTAGNVDFTITGDNFGTDLMHVVVTVGGADCPLTANPTHTMLICSLPRGEGVDKTVVVGVGNQLVQAATYFNYDGPEVFSMLISDLTVLTSPTTGGVVLTINGESFGTAANAVVTIGSATCELTFQSQDKITCSVPPGMGIDVPIYVKVGTLDANYNGATYALSYAPPTVLSVSPRTGAVGSATLVTISGESFGFVDGSNSIMFGTQICDPVVTSWSHTRIVCSMPGGLGQNLPITVSIKGQTFSAPTNVDLMFSYAGPAISSLTPTSMPTSGTNASDTATILTIYGTNFGPSIPAIPNPITVATVLTTIAPVTCTPRVGGWTDTRIYCDLSPGYGRFTVSVSVDHGSGNVLSTTSGNQRYATPAITGKSTSTSPTSGGGVLTISGTNFGQGPTSAVSVNVDSIACPVTSVTDLAIECTIPAYFGISRPVSVTIHAESITTPSNFVISYGMPTITAIREVTNVCTADVAAGTLTECPVTTDLPATKILVEGTNLFDNANGARTTINIGSAACANVAVITAHTQLSCDLPHRQSGYDFPVKVTVLTETNSALISNSYIGISYAGPKIGDVMVDGASVSSISEPSVNGGTVLTISGQDFGAALKVEVFIGDPTVPANECLNLAISNPCDASACSITCTIPPGVGKDLPITLKVETSPGLVQETAPSTQKVSYPPPVFVPSTIRLAAAETGATAVTGELSQGQEVFFDVRNTRTDVSRITVKYFGTDTSVTPSVDYNMPCNDIRAVTTADPDIFQISCITNANPGYDGPYSFSIDVAGQTASGTDTYSYPVPPRVSSVWSSTCTKSGDAAIDCSTDGGEYAITGTKFNLKVLEVRVGSTPCVITGGGDGPYVPPSETPPATWAPEVTHVICTLPGGSGKDNPINLVSGEFYAPIRRLVSFADPVVTKITSPDCTSKTLLSIINCPREQAAAPLMVDLEAPVAEAAVTSTTVTLEGRDFGTSGATVYVGEKLMADVTHDPVTPSKKLTFTLPAGFGINRDVLVIQANGGTAQGATISFALCPGGTFESNDSAYCAACPAGTYSEIAGSFACTPCGPGQYQDLTGQSTCKDCPIGQANKLSGQTACTDCLAGYYASATRLSECVACSAGMYNDAPAQTACAFCPAGTIPSKTSAATSCNNCAAGSYGAVEGAMTCTLCPAGKFSNTTGALGCTSCETGKVQALQGQTSCTNCGSGYYMEITDQTRCLPCDSGAASSITSPFYGVLAPPSPATPDRVTQCATCSSGTYSIKSNPLDLFAAGPTTCTACPAGKYTSSSGQQGCVDCPFGTYNPNPNQSTCQECGPGDYGDTVAATACKVCPSGKYTEKNAAVSCLSCAAGTYTPLANANTYCTACAAGKYQVASGASSCQSCAAGTYSPSTGQTSCIACTSGTYSAATGSSGCTACAVGRYSVKDAALDIGPTSCSACNAGTFASTTGQATCASCPTGYYSGSTAASSCTACASGTYNDQVGQSVCKTCPAGSFSGSAAVSCISCPTGYFKADSSNVCEACPAGTYAATAGAKTCTSCPAGQYNDALGQSSCRQCPIGRYSNTVGTTQCAACSAGKYQASAGAIECVNCAVGTYASATGQTSCFNCPKGEFMGNTGATKCTPCLAGKYGDATGLSDCTPCPVGHYAPTAKLTECLSCAPGTYQDLTGQNACLPCATGRYQVNSGSIGCTDCAAGRYASTTGLRECIGCPAGRYVATTRATSCLLCGVGKYNSAVAQTECAECAAGTYASVTGAISCIDCPLGKFQATTGKSSCSDCAAGTYRATVGGVACSDCNPGSYQEKTGQAACAACPSGKYQSASKQTTCDNCDAETFSLQTNGLGAVACTDCPVGKQQPYEGQPSCALCPAGSRQVDGVGCVLCPKGYYQPNYGATDCLACPIGTYSSSEGSLGCSSCAIGRYAAAEGTPECAECPAGTFQDSPGQEKCNTCPNGFYTSTTGQATCVACAVGTYQPTGVHDACVECDAGKYQKEVGKTTCIDCPLGEFGAAPGQINCIKCAPGTSNNLLGQSSCTPCTPGFYADVGGLATCKECLEGKYNADVGAFSCLDCAVGKYQAATGSSSCDSCVTGRYQDVMGETDCLDCPLGRYASNQGMSSCVQCSTGFFSNTTKSTTCSPCPMGTYQPQMGQSSCFNCLPGRFSDFTSAIDCTSCPPGSYSTTFGSQTCTACTAGKVQTLASQTKCDDCPAGKFTATPGQTQCVPCPSGTFNAAPGLSSCTQCEAGKYSELIGNNGPTSCSSCEPGTYQPNTAQERCIECASGRFTMDTAAKFCQPCAAGTYSYFTGSLDCTACEVGRYSDASASMECYQCPVGTFSTTVGSQSCTVCPAGKYQNNAGSSSCTDCPPGTYQDAENQSICLRCPIGRFSTNVGSLSCDACPTGRYASQAGLSECQPCGKGFYQDATGQGYCIPCQPGTYTTSDLAVSCELCPAGTHQPLAGGESCLLCDPGTYMASEGQARCTSCQAGKYNIDSGAQSCANCGAGTYQNVQGKTTCHLCPKGTFSIGSAVECSPCDLGSANAVEGNGFCVVCDPLTSTASNDGTECLCNAGYYLPDYTEKSPFPASDAYVVGTNDFKCAPCPTGADCSAKGNKWSTLKTAEGWWRATNETDVFYRCLMPSYCPGGVAAASTFTDTSGSPCMENRVGVLCQACEPGYKTAIGGGCEICPDSATSYISLIVFLVVIAALLCLSVYLLWRAGDEAIAAVSAPPKQEDDVTLSDGDEIDFEDEDDNEDDTAASKVDDNLESETLDDTAEEVVLDNIDPYSPQHISKILPGPPVPPPSFTYKLKIFLSFLQITTHVSSSLEIQWPDTFKSFVQFFDFANVDSLLTSVTSAECYDAVSYYSTYAATVLLPPIFLALITVFWIIPRSMNILCFRHQSVAERIRSRMRTWMLALYFLFLVYPVVSSTVLNHYVCKTITDSVNEYEFLLVDLRVPCKTDQWWMYAYIGIPLIFVYPFGIPAFFYTLLYRNRNKLQEPRIQAQYGFLYAGYHANVWWWEICDSLHKLFMTSLLAFFPVNAQLPVGMAVAVLYLMALLVFSPYIRSEDDVLHIICQNLIFMLLLAGYLFLKNGNVVLTDLEDVGMTIALLFAVIVFLGVFVAVTARTFKDFFIALYKRMFPKNMKPKDLTPLQNEVMADAAQEEAALAASSELAAAVAMTQMGPGEDEISVTDSATESESEVPDLSEGEDDVGADVMPAGSDAAEESVTAIALAGDDASHAALPTGMQPIAEEEEETEEQDEDEE